MMNTIKFCFNFILIQNITQMSQQGDDLEFKNGDQDFADHQDYEEGFQEHEEDHHEENHIGIHRDRAADDGQYDLDQSFQGDPDAILKVKAKIMFNINKERQTEQAPILYECLTMTSIAMQYATSIKNGHIDESYLKRLYTQQSWVNQLPEMCYVISKYEEQDIPKITKKWTEKFFIETAYLFFEMDKERGKLMSNDFTHIGIGLAGNADNIVIVLLVAPRDMTLLQIVETAEDRVEVRGKILTSSKYIFLVNIFDHNNVEVAESLYDQVEFNRQTKQFIIKLDMKTNWKQKRYIEILSTPNQPIGTRKPSKQRKNKLKKDLQQGKFRSLFFEYPDPRYIQYYNQEIEAEQNNQSNLSGMILESLHKQPQVKEEDKQDSPSQKNQDDDEDDDEDGEAQRKDQVSKEQKTSNREIKEELQAAIAEAKNAYDNVVTQNSRLQAKIKEMRDKNGIVLDKIGETSMNQHKYLNILAQVHQTRMELQLTQERYNRMSFELQSKLHEKQLKCNEIRAAFQDLKKQVAKKATYSRSDQPIKPAKIEEWQQAQSKLTQELQSLRLQILKARNALSKNQKILKKKQQLAEGLHLIDFEQLKIQNQTLNQKIEERNEDLHKLKKKTTTMVQILTHTRQKLVFVEKMKQDLASSNKILEKQINTIRGQITSNKQDCEKLRLEIQDAKQSVEIVNSQQLVVDFKKRAQHILKLEAQLKEMLEKQKEMKTVIEMYQRKIRKQAVAK